MASSSVSQESLDIDDIEFSARRSRIRTLRARGALHTNRACDRENIDPNDRDTNGDLGNDGDGGYGLGVCEHESPSRSAASRLKDKRTRPNHLHNHKGKLLKDKRKLREKRRSTGVVHLPSTESTGDSLDDEDDDENGKVGSETKKNTSYNEIIDADNPQTPSETRTHSKYASRRNKSPSDLEADLEDNQDYDSTVSHSETNLTLIGRSESTESPPQRSNIKTIENNYRHIQPAGVPRPYGISSYSTSGYSNTSDQDSKAPLSSTSSSSSVLSRFHEKDKFQEKEKAEYSKPVLSRFPFPSRCPERRYESYTTSRFSSQHEKDGVNNENKFGLRHVSPQKEDNSYLQRLLEKEREENKRLQRTIEEKDRRIRELENEVIVLNKDVDEFDEENQKLQMENRALIRAVSKLSTNV